MTTATNLTRYGWLVCRALAWKAIETAACLVSAAARRCVAEANASPAGCIDPLTPILDELDALHTDLFGE